MGSCRWTKCVRLQVDSVHSELDWYLARDMAQWGPKVWTSESHVSKQKMARVGYSPGRWNGVMAKRERRCACCLLFVAGWI